MPTNVSALLRRSVGGRSSFWAQRRRTSRVGGDRGATAVEFALVVLPLCLILMGIIDFGHIYNQQLGLSAAARESARVMAINNNVTSARAAARAAAPQFSPALTDAQISISPTTCTAGSNVTVTVTYPMSSLTGMFTSLVSGKTMQGTGVMRCGG